MIWYISFVFSLFCMILMFVLYYKDLKKYKKPTKFRPNISVIIPYYNRWWCIENTLKSIFDSYPKEKIDLTVIDDKSDDDNSTILKNLSDKYIFTIIKNKENKWKARSINDNIYVAKNEIVLFLDSDMVVSRENIESMLDRLYDKKTVAVSCPYIPIQWWFWWNMQKLEYVMMSYLSISHNIKSTMNLWWWLIMIQKDKFLEVWWFSIYAYTEDLEIVWKLFYRWYKVQQTNSFVFTIVPDTFVSWIKQKIRWNTWWFQCLLRYPIVWFRHPIYIIFLLSFIIFNLTFAVLIRNAYIFGWLLVDRFQLISNIYSVTDTLKILFSAILPTLISWFTIKSLFSLISLPFAIHHIKNFREIYNLLWIIPYSIIYIPMFSILWFVWMINWAIHYGDKKRNKRWR